MYRPINERDTEWLERLFSVDFKGKEILQEHLRAAAVEMENGYDFYSLKFAVDGSFDLYPYKVRVPVEMRVFPSDKAPIVFLLHVVNGTIDELEVFTADSSRLNINDICYDRIEYVVDHQVKA